MLKVTVGFPDLRLNANRQYGRSWMSTARAKSRARQEAAVCVMEALRSVEPADLDALLKAKNYRLYLLYIPPTRRRYDLGNLIVASKAHIDGLFDALAYLCPNKDDYQIVDLRARRCPADGRGRGATILMIEPVG